MVEESAPGSNLGCSKAVCPWGMVHIGGTLGFQGGLGQVFYFSKDIWVPLSFPTSLFSLQNGITGFAACRLFPYCGIGDCRVVSNLEIAGIADSKQN